MNDFVLAFKGEFENCLNHLRNEYKSIRAGRANPELLDVVVVEAYGSKMPLKQLASVTTPDARTLLISPWDKNLIKEIEKGVSSANLGLNAIVKGDSLMVNIPTLTEEKRKEVAKLSSKKAEESKIAVRGVREMIKTQIKEAESSKEISEDNYYLFIKELDEYISEVNLKIKKMEEEKIAEIMSL